MNRGFTLLEAIIYIVILAGLSLLFINLLFTMVDAYAEFRVERNLTDSAALGLNRLVYEIRRAKNVNSATTVDHLKLDTTDENNVAATAEFYLSTGTLVVKMSSGNGLEASTTATGVTVDNLAFHKINTAHSVAVKIDLTLTASRRAITQTQKFHDTAVLRGFY